MQSVCYIKKCKQTSKMSVFFSSKNLFDHHLTTNNKKSVDFMTMELM